MEKVRDKYSFEPRQNRARTHTINTRINADKKPFDFNVRLPQNCRRMLISAVIFPLVCTGLLGWCGITVYANQDEGRTLPEDKNVRVLEEKNGGSVTFVACLTNCSEATITLSLTLSNMSASCQLPVTIDALGRSSFAIATIWPTNKKELCKYNRQYYWMPGRRSGVITNSSFVYALPYVDETHTVIQGPLGRLSHRAGSTDENAIDWAMIPGTPVCVARKGVVVGIRQDSDIGGHDLRYKRCNNYVVIRHDDGTFAEYCHLKKDSVLVKLGQKVKSQKPLALSGNTGCSSFPHLHFAVYYPLDGKTRITIPVKFRTKTGTVVTLKEGDSF